MLLIAGQFDLVPDAGVGFAGMLMAVAALAPGTGGVDLPLAMNMTVPSAFIIAVLGTMMIEVLNGFFVTVVGINALVTTLGTLAVFRGLTKVLGDGQTMRIEGFGALGVERVFGIPLPVYIFAACVVVFWLVLRCTVYGRSLYAIGASPSAARLAGIRTKRVIFIAFLLSSAMVALAGLIRLSQVAGASVNSGLGIELSVMRRSSSAARACPAAVAVSVARSWRCSSSGSWPAASSSSTCRRSGSRWPAGSCCWVP